MLHQPGDSFGKRGIAVGRVPEPVQLGRESVEVVDGIEGETGGDDCYDGGNRTFSCGL